MTIRRLYWLLLSFFLFLAILIGEYLACGVFFRLVRPSDLLILYSVSGLCALGLCYFIFRQYIKIALQEKIPAVIVWGVFLFFTLLSSFFIRFSLQLANGALDFSDPETHSVAIVDREITSFGGSIEEGINPIAHMVYFLDWDQSGRKCQVLTPQDFYYSVDIGNDFQVTVGGGLFHWPWVKNYQAVK